MSFYVTLPSNNPALPNNTQSSYTTLFNQPISLDGTYEVALSEITYSSRVKVEIGELIIRNPLSSQSDEFVKLLVKTNNGQKSADFFSELNDLIRIYLLIHEYKVRYNLAYGNTEEVYNEIRSLYKTIVVLKRSEEDYEVISDENKKLENASDSHEPYRYQFKSLERIREAVSNKRLTIIQVPESIFHTPSTFERHLTINKDKILNDLHLNMDKKYDIEQEMHSIPTFTINNSDELIINYKNEKALTLTGSIAQLLDKKDKIIIEEPTRFQFVHYMSIINYAAIYTDFIEEQYVGGEQTPILRIINIKSSEAPDTVTFFDNPHYVKVKKTSISSINIRILDLTGNPIKFDDLFSFVILKLHFKKI
jgi:hypothetical protein